MARRKHTEVADLAVDAATLRWRLSWLIRSQNPACDPPNPRQQALFQEAANESARLERAGLPLADQVAGVEAFLAARGSLARAERLIAHLSAAREGGRH